MTSTEALNNFFLSVIIIFTVYFILDLIGNAMLLKSTGQKMWIGFIPVVNDFFIFRSFWNAKMFVVYIASFTINILASKYDWQPLVYIQKTAILKRNKRFFNKQFNKNS